MEIILFSNKTKLKVFSFPLIETKLNRLIRLKLIHLVSGANEQTLSLNGIFSLKEICNKSLVGIVLALVFL